MSHVVTIHHSPEAGPCIVQSHVSSRRKEQPTLPRKVTSLREKPEHHCTGQLSPTHLPVPTWAAPLHLLLCPPLLPRTSLEHKKFRQSQLINSPRPALWTTRPCLVTSGNKEEAAATPSAACTEHSWCPLCRRNSAVQYLPLPNSSQASKKLSLCC